MTESTLTAGGALNALRELAEERRSGVLASRRGSAGIHICLQDGRVVFATSNLLRFQHNRWLTAAGLAHHDALKMAGPTRGTKELVDNLVKHSGLDRMDLVSSLRALLKEMVLEALTWHATELRFSPGVPVLREHILIDDAADGLIQAAEEHLENTPARKAPREVADPVPAPAEQDPHGHNPEVAAFREKVQLTGEQNYYELLDLDSKADSETVRKHYYHLARAYHPDALRGILAEVCRPEAEEYFATVTDAYNTLTRPEQRKEYDQQLGSQASRDREQRQQQPTELAKLNFISGTRALAAGELHDAAQFFRNAVQLHPDHGEYHRELGIVEMRNPRWQKSAEVSLRRAIELEQTDTRALAHLGQIYQENGLKRRATETYQKALDWDPENEMAHAGLAALGASSGSERKSLFSRG